MQILSIQIIDPDTDAPVSVDIWEKDSHPTRAEWLLIKTDELAPFLLHKKIVKGAEDSKLLTFDEALRAGNTLTRAQGIALCEAGATTNINAILDVIGGDRLRDWIWTCETDSTMWRNKTNTNAWNVYLPSGDVETGVKSIKCNVRLVANSKY